MRKTTLVLIGLVFALMAAACGASDSETVNVTGGSDDQGAEAPTPSPDSAVSVSSDQVDTTTPTPSPTPVVPASDRQPVIVEDVEIVVRESWPMQVAVMISGSLPTPCHELRWTVEQSATTTSEDWTVAADGSEHTITVWTTDLPADTVCATVMEPFSEQVELGRFVSGDYTIVVNGERFPVTL